MKIELSPHGSDETELTLTQEALPDTETFAGHERGWAQILDRLAGWFR